MKQLPKSFWLPALGSALILVGCSASSSVESDSANDGAKPIKQVAFQGNPDPALAGTWVSAGGDSIFELDKDGKLETTSIIRVPGSTTPQEHQRVGSWGVTDKTLYTKTTDSSGDTVAKYAFEQKGSSLTLFISGMKMKTVFHRR